MHAAFRRRITDNDIARKVKFTVIPTIKDALDETSDPCPTECLCHNLTDERLARHIGRFSDGTLRTDAVYVLECKPRERDQYRFAVEQVHASNPTWTRQARKHERLIYIGMTVAPVRRIREHAESVGAHFTRIFPPIRVLNITYYESVREAYRAETITYREVRNQMADDIYVYQQ